MSPEKEVSRIIDQNGLQQLIALLRRAGYNVVGPTVRDGAIIYDEIAGIEDLPSGWTDRQEAGVYRLERRDDDAFFGFNVGPSSWKRFLQLPRRRLWRAERDENGSTVTVDEDAPPKYAFIGVRSCELHAIAIQDRVLTGSAYQDNSYAQRRNAAVIIAVNCGQAGGTCFCASMSTGPKASSGFDLCLTELLDETGHRFMLEVGSETGRAFADDIVTRRTNDADHRAADAAVATATSQMGRTLDTVGVKELLQQNQDHPRWDDVAERCLTCANCTIVCPTCFCTTVEDTSDLDGSHAERWQRWDSCFTLDHSYIHGGQVRRWVKSRYRQWMTHKLAHWIDQFGTSGCVGCGRCITWCPVGIDITEETAAIRDAVAHEGGSA